uniref:Uncharacterized protein n=1 Tax=Candidatus Methanogaster sp. ANME-2c ERB4 TaxID=2759911 RepID=A0A7G9YQV0_9EURY|nr:hypothetical protein CKJHOKLD_00005 [Methanosarcinales archaeon ANME-2c ERB4]
MITRWVHQSKASNTNLKAKNEEENLPSTTLANFVGSVLSHSLNTVYAVSLLSVVPPKFRQRRNFAYTETVI